MSKPNTKSTSPVFRYLETWDTRFGKSQRIVTRDKNGKFLDTVSLSGLLNAPNYKGK
jgi:hypothetical protein